MSAFEKNGFVPGSSATENLNELATEITREGLTLYVYAHTRYVFNPLKSTSNAFRMSRSYA